MGRGITRRQAIAYVVGWFTLFVALVSPLHPMGEVLFSAHMTQHELLMLVAAPLIVMGKPLITYSWALPSHLLLFFTTYFKAKVLRAIGNWISRPVNAWIIQAVALWVWHIPLLFEGALRSNWVHAAQHTSFLGSALLFWWALIRTPRAAKGYGVAALFVFTTSLHSGFLGALITFAPTVLYQAYLPSTASWGLSPLEDQQLGGLIMWVPAGLIYIIAGLVLCAGWIRESEKSVVTDKQTSYDLSEVGG